MQLTNIMQIGAGLIYHKDDSLLLVFNKLAQELCLSAGY